MVTSERRRHRRLNIRVPMAYTPAGAGPDHAGRSVTLNISTMGLYFESFDQRLREGMALDLSVTVPPAAGVSPYETEVSATGEIVRVVPLRPNPQGNADDRPRSGVAVSFNSPVHFDLSV